METQELADTRTNATLVVSVYLLATTTLIVPVGHAGDHFGKRTVLVTGLVVYIIGATLEAATTSLPMLISASFLQSAGTAAMPLAQIRYVVAPVRVGRWMA